MQRGSICSSATSEFGGIPGSCAGLRPGFVATIRWLLQRWNFSGSTDRLRRTLCFWLGRKNEQPARYAHHELSGSCPLDLERARSPAARKEEVAAFNACWKPKWAKAEEKYRQKHGGEGPMD